MNRYCLDTSGLSNPLESMPEDIYGSLWKQVRATIEKGVFCWNAEILDELGSIQGDMGACLAEHGTKFCFEVGDDGWPWQKYLEHFESMRTTHEAVISEYNGNRKNTVGLNDVSIIALAKTLELPVVSMESLNTHQPSEKRMRIPAVCAIEKVKHLSFNGFLRAEGIKI